MKLDASTRFVTGEAAFDDFNKRTESLHEYVLEDTISAGPYTTYLFIENHVDGHERVLGLLRFKDVPIDTLQEEVRKTDIPPMHLEKFFAGLGKTRVVSSILAASASNAS